MKRRSFLRQTSALSVGAGLGYSFFPKLSPLRAEDVVVTPGMVQFGPEIEPLVKLLEKTPRERILEEFGHRIRTGAISYREVLAALKLAGVRNIQPRPVGFKFHAVLVVHSAHLASIASPDSDRWLPLLWALDYYKKSEAEDVSQNDWTMSAVVERDVPPADKAKAAFIKAMDDWDVDAADVAVTGLARGEGAAEVFEIFARYGSRDFRDIGHKAIFVANAWRTLQTIGWQHSEPVLRSLAYALLDHEGDNPAQRDADADRPWRINQTLAETIPQNWQAGQKKPEMLPELMKVLREASSEEACRSVVAHLKQGMHPQTIWDAGFEFAAELLMRRPGIVSLHALTTANAIHYTYQTVSDDHTRRMLLLQNMAFMTMFRQDPADLEGADQRVLDLPDVAISEDPQEALRDVFEEINRDRYLAAQKTLAFCRQDPLRAEQFVDEARRLLFVKGDNAHDYKFNSAILEDYYHVSPSFRDHYLAASVYNLRSSGDRDNDLIARARTALG